jgi:hypothetical protein
MMYFVELQFFDKTNLFDLRQKMQATANTDTSWIEWTPALTHISEHPDFTLIGPQRLCWGKLAQVANAAYGRHVMLVGDSLFTLGLPVLPKGFAMDYLPAFMSWDNKRSGKIPHVYEPDYKLTIPASQ